MPQLYYGTDPDVDPKRKQKDRKFKTKHFCYHTNCCEESDGEMESRSRLRHKLLDWAIGLREDLRSKLEHEAAKLDNLKP